MSAEIVQLKPAAVTPATEIRICKDCKWAKPDRFLKNWLFAKCTHPVAGVKHPRMNEELVTGNPTKVEYWYCSTNRMIGSDQCGSEGYMWESRENKNGIGQKVTDAIKRFLGLG